MSEAGRPSEDTRAPGSNPSFNEKVVFLAALSLQAVEREAFIQGACPGEAERSRIRTLLNRHAESSTEGLRAKVEHADSAPASDARRSDELVDVELPYQIGDFELRNEVGRGGMGVVYLARDLVLERDVAVKVLGPRYGSSAKFLASFKQEAVLASQLQHPSIVPVFRFGDHKGMPFIVTPYIEGKTLRERFNEEQSSSHSSPRVRSWRREVADVIATIAEALDRAHAASIVHRDVKPSNIIIDETGRPHLLDVGISIRAGGDEVFSPVANMGSTSYASPEQLDGLAIDSLSDVFSLGVVLYESLTGRRPFDGIDRTVASQRNVASIVRRVDRSIPVDLDVICQKAMAIEKPDRYQSAAHMAADLRAWLADRPILARPDPLPRRVRRWGERHRAAVLAGVAAVITLLTSVAVFWIMQDPRPRLLLDGVPDSARITIQSLAVPLGAPYGEVTIVGERSRPEVGWYRILVVDEDGAQAEYSRWLGLETTTVILVSLVSEPVATEDMVRFDPLQDPPHPDIADLPGTTSPLTQPFWIDRHEVSNADYEAFVLDASTSVEPPTYWGGLRCPEHFRQLPVVGITWAEARAYAEWAGKRLPTVAEWLHVASGTEGRRYTTRAVGVSAADLGVRFVASGSFRALGLITYQPATIESAWAQYQDNARAVDDPGHGIPDRTPEGMINMYGNVREWTDSLPFHEAPEAKVRLLTGFCWEMPGTEPPSMFVVPEQAVDHRVITTGFRCARSERPTLSLAIEEAP